MLFARPKEAEVEQDEYFAAQSQRSHGALL